MNLITKLNSSPSLFISLLLITAISACSEAKTSSDAPSSANASVAVSTNSPANQDDAQSETRRKQLDADIRSREQRNDFAGNPLKRTDSDLASEVRSKLEANIPQGKLTIVAKDSQVTVSGAVANLEQLNKIKTLAMEIKGVNGVMVKAVVAP
jgi:hyperosmotically inducible periplasmic protein